LTVVAIRKRSIISYMSAGRVLDKYNRLKDIFAGTGPVLVAFSGGVDSTLLLKAASDILGHKVLAVTAVSSIRPVQEIEIAEETAKALNVKHLVIRSTELQDEKVSGNSEQRCYYCKKRRFSELKKIAEREGIAVVIEGSHINDADMYRPGEKAIDESGIRSPLKEAGLSKEEIRDISKQLGLSNWGRPSESCLLTRFPYGVRIDAEALNRVQKAENILSERGYREIRVRVYRDHVRVEVCPDQVDRLLTPEEKDLITEKFKDLGYTKTEIDPAGYRTGSMDEGISWTGKK